MYPYYYSLAKKECYFFGKVPPCCVCDTVPDRIMWVIFNNLPKVKGDRVEHYCGACLSTASKRLKMYSKYCDKQLTAINNFIIVESLPSQVIPYNITPINQVTKSNTYDCFTLAHDNVEGESVIDNTRLSGRYLLEGVRVGVAPELLEGKAEPLTDEQLNTFFLNVKNSKIVGKKEIK